MTWFRFLIMAAILLTATTIHIYYYQNTVGDPVIIRHLNTTRRMIENSQLAESKAQIKKIREQWERKKPWLRLNVSIRAVSELSTEIALLEEAVRLGDSKMAHLQVIKLKDLWQDLNLFK